MSLLSYQQAYDAVIRMMAECLVLPPAVEPYRLGECVDRWREQRIAEICINEFGDDARAEARRLLQVAGVAEQVVPLPPVSPLCGPGKLFTNVEGAQRALTGPHAEDRRCNGAARSLGANPEEGGGADDRCRPARRDGAPSSGSYSEGLDHAAA